jgi:phosphate transport system substrate-binding protein
MFFLALPFPLFAAETSDFYGRIVIQGSWSGASLMTHLAREFEQMHSLVQIVVEPQDFKISLENLKKGVADLIISPETNCAEVMKKYNFHVGIAQDTVMLAVNPKNPFAGRLIRRGVTRTEMIDVFITGKIKYWEQILGGNSETPIHPYTRSDHANSAEVWAHYLGKWADLLKGGPVKNAATMRLPVVEDIYSIGYLPTEWIYNKVSWGPENGILPLPFDFNANGRIDPEEDYYSTMNTLVKAHKDGLIPQDLIRTIYLVSHKRPTMLIIKQFLKWVLTDGQILSNTLNYLPVPEESKKLDLQSL